MCGILGCWNINTPVDQEQFNAMRDTLRHRGPDGYGSWFHGTGMLALGHRRLSFLDLSETGKQPLCNEDKSIWLTVNGEIYNYIELKQELQEAGHVFRSSGDSEVIVHAYEEWGISMLNKLDGMFAFGLWDENKKTMLLARDPFGIKPLYYYCNNGEFIFASELKAIVYNKNLAQDIDFGSVCDFFHYRYVPSPKTIYKNMFKLEPGHFIEMEAPNLIMPVRYHQFEISENKKSLCKSSKIIDRLLQESVSTHVRSDVPIGSFLSGGFDSSAMVKYFSNVEKGFNTFSIGFTNWDKSEHLYAQKVADIYETKQHTHILDESSLNELSEIMYFYDEPIADISIIPTYRVSRLAAEHNKAVLSGEGADELFAGYTWHRKYLWALDKKQLRLAKKYSWDIPVNHFDVSSYSKAMEMGLFDVAELKQLLNHSYHKYIPDDADWFYRKHFDASLSVPKRFQVMDLNTFMPELVLVKVDRASMAHSLEVRVPFLSNKIVNFMMGLNPKSYFRAQKQKPILYNLLKNDLPKAILTRKKQGFTGPDHYYFNIGFYREILVNGQLIKSSIVNSNYIEKLLADNDYWRLWKIVVFEFWFRNWINDYEER